MLLNVGCEPTDDICISVSKYAFLFSISCVYHAVVSYMAANRASSIMPLLNPVSSGAVRL